MRCCCGLFIWFLQVEISLIPSLDEFIWVPIHICKHEDIWFRTCVSSLFWGGNHGVFQSGGNCIWMGSLYDCSFSFTANSGQNGSQQPLPTAKPLRMEICFSPLSQMIDWLKMDRLTYRTQVFVCCYKKRVCFHFMNHCESNGKDKHWLQNLVLLCLFRVEADLFHTLRSLRCAA